MRSNSRRSAILAAIIATLALVGTACSNSGDESQSTTTQRPTTTLPEGQAPEDLAPGEAGEVPAEEPPEPAWIVQIGGAGTDRLSSVTGRNDSVLAVGDTGSDLGDGPAAEIDSLTLVVDTEGQVVSLRQSGGPGVDRPQSVGFGTNSEVGDVTIACGSTTSALNGPNSGLMDAWCGSIGAEDFESIHQQGSPEDDELVAVAIDDEAVAGPTTETFGSSGAVGYAAGSSGGFFPGASDTSAGSLGGGDALFWQIDADGFPLWIRQFGTATEDAAEATAVTSDGDGVVAGYTWGDLGGPSKGGSDGFVSRFDPEGLPRWTEQFGSGLDEWANGVSVGGDPAQGTETIVAVGATTGKLAPVLGSDATDPLDAPRADGAEPAPDNAGGTDALVTAFDATGDETWTSQLGTDADDEAIAVVLDGQTVLVAGTTAGSLATTGDPAAGEGDGFLAALDRDTGTLRWITQFGSAGDENVTAMTTTEDGLVVISGSTTGQMGEQPNAGDLDGFLIAYPLPSAGGAVASSL